MSKNIMVISTGLANGGLERVSSILANELCERGYKVYFLAVYLKEKTYKLDERIKYKYIDTGNVGKLKRYWFRSKEICREIKIFRPDYIYSFVSQEMLLAQVLSGRKIIYSERTDPSKGGKIDIWSKRFVYAHSYKMVFQTPIARDFFNRKTVRKSTIVGNPIEEYLPVWNGEKCRKQIVMACRIAQGKNIEMLIKAFEVFEKKHQDYEVMLYGEVIDQEYFDKMQNLVHKKGLEKKFHFCGFNSNVHEKEIEAEMFVLTSNYEGLSNSMLEALCMGIPSICTDCPCGGAALYIKDGVNGFLVDVNDDVALAKKMALVADNPELRVRISEKAKEARRIFSKEKIIDEWENLMR